MAHTLPRTILKPEYHIWIMLESNYELQSKHVCSHINLFLLNFLGSKHVKKKWRVWLCGRDSNAFSRNYCLCFSSCTQSSSSLTIEGVSMRKWGRKDGWYLPTLPACLHFATTVPVACLSPALESEQSRTSVDESGNRHREVLSKSWASSSVNWAVVSRAASMAWRMNQRRPERICSQGGRKENNTYKQVAKLCYKWFQGSLARGDLLL